jgi:hypothetical protein
VITAHVAADSLDWALAHTERYGDTDLFPTLFEIHAIKSEWDSLRPSLTREDLDTRHVGVLRRCMAPKGRFSYRVATQLDPLDLLFYTALVYEIGTDLEAFRVPASEEIVYSFRFAPSDAGRMFDPSYNYGAFLQRCQTLADEGSFGYVVTADIADFFPRVYLHRIESTLQLATTKGDQSRALLKLLRGWNDRVSYGIPVGPSASRLIAEATIHDVDQCLLAEGATYCRYSDDFRIFCSSKSEAYSKLEALAALLHESHGLSLQPDKTEILPIGKFKKKYLETPHTVELQSLRERFWEIVEQLGLEDPYGELDYDDLDEGTQAEIDSLNLSELLEDLLSKEDIDIGLFRFILRRLGQLNQSTDVETVIAANEKCYPAIPSVVSYLATLSSLEIDESQEIGRRLVDLLDNSLVSQLPYNRCWLLSLFSDSDRWGQASIFPGLYGKYPDPFSQRKVILAMGRAKQQYWFRRMRSDVMQLSPWSRRAFLAASSCMAADEVKHWYGSISSRVESLDRVVMEWARSNPF